MFHNIRLCEEGCVVGSAKRVPHGHICRGSCMQLLEALTVLGVFI